MPIHDWSLNRNPAPSAAPPDDSSGQRCSRAPALSRSGTSARSVARGTAGRPNRRTAALMVPQSDSQATLDDLVCRGAANDVFNADQARTLLERLDRHLSEGQRDWHRYY